MRMDQTLGQTDLPDLRHFLHALCVSGGREGFVHRLASKSSRWSTVKDLLKEQAKAELYEIAFRPRVRGEGFSECNLKAHYVLDEDFINNGSAIVLFSLVGALWTHIEYVSDQNEFTTAEMWLEEEKP